MGARKEVLAEGVEVWLGDCKTIFSQLPKIDAVITDPPYGIRANENPVRGQWGSNVQQGSEWDRERPSADIFKFMLKASREQIIWGGIILQICCLQLCVGLYGIKLHEIFH